MQGLVTYGHSWVAGDGASRPARRFVELVARQLGGVLINLGVGGSASRDTAALVIRDPPPPARVYVLMTGLNDARLYGRSQLALDSYTSALGTVFTAMHDVQPTALIVAVQQPYLADYSLHAPHNRGSDALIDAYNDRLRHAASRGSQIVVAVPTRWDSGTMLAEDTVHPDDAGHAELARCVLAALVTHR